MSRTVLLVEDEPNIIEAISFLLERDGWTVRLHSSGQNALEAVERTQPDVMILDVMLPGGSGFDILRSLRQDARYGDLPVLMLTARGQAKDRELAESLGASEFMVKPFSNAQMLATVRALSEQVTTPTQAAP